MRRWQLLHVFCAFASVLAIATRSDAQVVSPPIDIAEVMSAGATIEYGGVRFSNFQALGDSPLSGAVTISTIQVGESVGLSFTTQPSILSTNTTALEPRFAVSFVAEKTGGAGFGHGIIAIDGAWTGSGAIQSQYEMSEIDDSGPSIFAAAVQSGMGHNNKRAAIGSFYTSGVHRIEVRILSGAKVFTLPGYAKVTNIQFLLAESGLLSPAGDFTFDGRVDGADLLLWQRQVGSAYDLESDGNRDGKVDAADLQAWRETFGVQIGPPGDFDGDGKVNGSDFLIWQRALGTSNSTVDANKNGIVDQADLTTWHDNFGADGSRQATVSSVPEPTAWLLGFAGLGLAWSLARSRR